MELKAFLTKIAEDPITTKAFGQDPAGTMEAAGLAPADRAAVMSQDRDVISKRLGINPQALGIELEVTVRIKIKL
jgi:hypothetical protein